MRRNTKNDTMEEIKEAVIEAKAQEKQEDVESKHEKVSKNLENIYAERLKQKAAELDAIEKVIDQKISDFKDFVQKTALGGRGIAAIEKGEKEQKADATQERINKLMAFGR